MIQSIVDDVKAQFSYGNMITKIILVNLFVFFVVIIFKAFSPPSTGIYDTFLSYLALSSDGLRVLTRPWTLFSHMVLHEGIWHIGWNMLMLYWFGRIVGDLAGDKRILPLYILGGLAGGFLFLIYAQMAGLSGGIALGASGAVMCFVVAAGFLAPDYNMRLLLIGDVRLKYISAALVLIDLVMLSERNNPGGRFAHLGGAILGGTFVHLLRQGIDITSPLQLLSRSPQIPTRTKKAPMTVVHNKKRSYKETKQEPPRTRDLQQRIDEILDKINDSGYDSLTAEEKDFLYQASKK